MKPTDVAMVIGELLDVDDMAVDDNFFDMGGTSVLALQLLLQLEKRWGVTLSLIDVVYNPTPEGLARRLAETHSSGASA